jgi:hypothetical protein
MRVGVLPVVEMPCRTGRVRIGMRSRRPAEGASYESESERGRGVPSSRPRASRSTVEVHRLLFLALLCWRISVSFVLTVDCGHPYTIGTDNMCSQELRGTGSGLSNPGYLARFGLA